MKFVFLLFCLNRYCPDVDSILRFVLWNWKSSLEITIYNLNLLNNFVVQSPPWETGKEIFPVFWNPKVHFYVYVSLTRDPILSHLKCLHPQNLFVLRSTLVLSYHLRPGLPSGVFIFRYFFFTYTLNVSAVTNINS